MKHLRKHQWPLHDCIILQCGIYAKAAITDIFISDFIFHADVYTEGGQS